MLLLIPLLAATAGCPVGSLFAPADTDGDGTPDRVDGCPHDPHKTGPGDCGCGVFDTDEDFNGISDCIQPPAQPGVVAGTLSVQFDSNTRTFLEQEPNNDLVQTQFIARVTAGDHLTLFGSASASGDPFDAFEFDADVPLRLELFLSFATTGDAAGADLDLGLYDFETFACTPGGEDGGEFAHCFDAMSNPETGDVQIAGPFILVIAAANGRTDYQLDVIASSPTTFSAPAPAATTPGTVPASNGVQAKSRRTARQLVDGGAFDAARADVSPAEIVIRFQPGADPQTCEALAAHHGMTLTAMSPSGLCRLGVASAAGKDARRSRADALRGAAGLRGEPLVAFAEPNYRRYIAREPNDEYYNLQWHYSAINLPSAWDFTTGSNDVIVAVIDSGVLQQHPDLQGRLFDGHDFISDPTAARDGDGIDPDPEDEGDLFGGPGRSSFHGTHVAGTLGAAADNATGVAGATWQTRIMPIRALGVDGGSVFDLAEAMRYAAGLPNASEQLPPEPARIINLSLSGSAGQPPSRAESEAIADVAAAGVLIVAAAGNEGSGQPAYPAAAPEVISVAAVDIQLRRANYSNFGSTVDIAAPGGFTGGDFNGDGFADGVLSTGGSDAGGRITYEYRFSNGTSMASPHVAAVAALVMAANPALSAAEVRQVLESTAHDLGDTGRDDLYGHGLVDAAAAVREALRRAGNSPEDIPILTLSGSSIDFGAQRESASVRISNTGGGFLNVAPPVVQGVDPPDDASWLSAELAGGNDGTSSTELLLTVNRDNLVTGGYRATVRISAADISPTSIDVTMRVGDAPALNETIFVLAVRPISRTTVRQDETDSQRGFAYRLESLPVGSYALFAGTDRDDDGFICDIGDLCGALPSTLEPDVIRVESGQELDDVDFSVARLVLEEVTAAGATPQARLQRLR